MAGIRPGTAPTLGWLVAQVDPPGCRDRAEPPFSASTAARSPDRKNAQFGGTARVLLNPPPGRPVMTGIQVRDIHAGHARLAAVGVPVVREPAAEPWGLIETQFEDPGGIRIVLAEVPAGHPLRRDPRSALPLR